MSTRYVKGTVGKNGNSKRILIDVELKVEYLELKDEEGEPSGTMIIYGKDHTRMINQPWEKVLGQLGVELSQKGGQAKKTPVAF